VNHGTLHAPTNKNILVWNVGQRFPAKHSEITMSAILQLGASKSEKSSTLEEEFCSGQNAFAKVRLLNIKFSLSVCLSVIF